MIVAFTGEVFRWEARADSWYFVALPPQLSAEIAEMPRMPRGFGSVRVLATIGVSQWRTSIFPDGQRDAYVVPLKRAVREAESIGEGDRIEVTLQVIDS